MSDPRLQQLASEAARQIKAVTSERDSEIQAIYLDYREKAALIRAEASVDSLRGSDTDSRPEPHPQSIKH